MNWSILNIRRDKTRDLRVRVPMEEPLEIRLNGHTIALLMRLPGLEKELAAGFCISEGYVRGVSDILLIEHCGLQGPETDNDSHDELGTSRNRVEIRAAENGILSQGRSDAIQLIRSGCGATHVSVLSKNLPVLPEGFGVTVSILLGLRRTLRGSQTVYEQVGGTHSAAIFDAEGRPLCIGEDIGRHNAVDKAAGHCLLRRIPLDNKLLVTSGRASYEMVTKAVRLGIPVVASFSAATSLAIQLAQEQNLTLIGYLRSERLNLYTHGERVR